MKNYNELIKDVTLYVVAALIGGTIFNTSLGASPFEWGIPFFFFGFFPFGWRWVSTVIEAGDIMGLVLKIMLTFVVSIVAGPVVLIKDVILATRS
jgi:hypothetical protein